MGFSTSGPGVWCPGRQEGFLMSINRASDRVNACFNTCAKVVGQVLSLVADVHENNRGAR